MKAAVALIILTTAMTVGCLSGSAPETRATIATATLEPPATATSTPEPLATDTVTPEPRAADTAASTAEPPAATATAPAEQPGDETEAQRITREATIEAIQTRYALTPAKDTSQMLRLSAEESACLRRYSPDSNFTKFMRAVAERDFETTRTLHSCLTRETTIVLLLMNDQGAAPDLSDDTWACISLQTEGMDMKAALALKHELEPENPSNLDDLALADTAPMAMLVCVSDGEFESNAPRLGADEATRQVLRCMAEATGGVGAMILASRNTSPAAAAAYEAQVAECT